MIKKIVVLSIISIIILSYIINSTYKKKEEELILSEDDNYNSNLLENIKYVAKDEDPRDYRVDFKKLSKIINNRSYKTIDFGIKEIINFLKSQRNPKKFLKFGNFIIEK